MKVRNNDRTPSSKSSSKELSSKSIDAVTNKSIQDNLCVFGFFFTAAVKYLKRVLKRGQEYLKQIYHT